MTAKSSITQTEMKTPQSVESFPGHEQWQNCRNSVHHRVHFRRELQVDEVNTGEEMSQSKRRNVISPCWRIHVSIDKKSDSNANIETDTILSETWKLQLISQTAWKPRISSTTQSSSELIRFCLTTSFAHLLSFRFFAKFRWLRVDFMATSDVFEFRGNLWLNIYTVSKHRWFDHHPTSDRVMGNEIESFHSSELLRTFEITRFVIRHREPQLNVQFMANLEADVNSAGRAKNSDRQKCETVIPIQSSAALAIASSLSVEWNFE